MEMEARIDARDGLETIDLTIEDEKFVAAAETKP